MQGISRFAGTLFCVPIPVNGRSAWHWIFISASFALALLRDHRVPKQKRIGSIVPALALRTASRIARGRA